MYNLFYAINKISYLKNYTFICTHTFGNLMNQSVSFLFKTPIRILHCLLFIVLTQANAASTSKTNSWTLLKESNGVTLYEKESPTGETYAFRGVGIIKSDLITLSTIISDPALMREWVYWCEKIELIERNFSSDSYDMHPSDFDEVIYGVTYLPWPYQNRDWVVRGKINIDTSDSGTLPVITLKASVIEHPLVPHKEDLFRMDLLTMSCSLTPQADSLQNTVVDFTYHYNPGGHFPQWLVNISGDQMPLYAFEKLKELIFKNMHDPKMTALFTHQVAKLFPKAITKEP